MALDYYTTTFSICDGGHGDGTSWIAAFLWGSLWMALREGIPTVMECIVARLNRHEPWRRTAKMLPPFAALQLYTFYGLQCC